MNELNDSTVIRQVDEHDAKCPSCGASIKFNPANGLLTCPYCGYEEEVKQPEAETDSVVQELDFNEAINRASFQWGKEKKVVICSACAAESVYDELEIANVCPYCGSNHVMEVAADNALAPNGIAPFQITKQQANENFQKWIKGKFFAPNEAKRSAKAEAFHGFYLPYWTFDARTASQYSANYGRNRTVTDRDGKTRVVTDWYSTTGFYQEFIDDTLVRASTRHDDQLMQTIEPYQTNNVQSYNAEYLTGYVAERYSVGLEDGWKVAQRKIKDHLEAQISSEVRSRHQADIVSNVRFSTSYSNITYKYLLLPLWHSSFQYKQKSYEFMVNGQTGKVGGQSPISAIKVTIAIILAILIVALLYSYGEGYIG